MFTELILGCSLTKDLPKECVNALNNCINSSDVIIDDFSKKYKLMDICYSESAYFGSSSNCKFEEYPDYYQLSIRSNLKNYFQEIENFLGYLKPYVLLGSGINNFYAIVTYEEDSYPTIWFKDKTVNLQKCLNMLKL